MPRASKRVSDEIIGPAGLYAVRWLATLRVGRREELGPTDAMVALLNAIWSRIGNRPGQWLNSLELIGLRIAANCSNGRFYVAADRPVFGAQDTPGECEGDDKDGPLAILDTHYLNRDPSLGESAIRNLEKGTKTPNCA